MTNLRRRLARAVRTVARLAPCALALSLACPHLLASGSRSRVHHPGAAALPPSNFVETGRTVSGTKRHRGAARGESGPRQSTSPKGAAAHPGRGAKSRRSHGRQAEPNEDLIPMYRAGRDSGHSQRELPRQRTSGRRGERVADELAWARSGGKGAMVRGRRSAAVRGRQGRYAREPELASTRGRTATLPAPKSGHGSSRPATPTNVSTHAAADGARGVDAVLGAAPGGATARAPVYAEGVSHPDDDERLPTTNGPIAQVDAGRGAPPTGTSQLVEGFGGEVAAAGAESSQRPGGTRRRNHPTVGSALPDLGPAPSLEEREAITEAAVSPAVLPEIYDRDGRLLMPAPLRGSREVLVHQNEMATNDGVGRIRDDGELDRLRADRLLVSFPLSSSLHINEALPLNRRYARPWTVLFAVDIAHDFYARFHQALQVTSAVRTVTYQARLQRVNGNAAATAGDAASPHLTGQAIDLGKRGMSAEQLAWMRAYLLPLMEAGKIDVEEEFQQACFHISVYRRYAGARPVHEVAQLRTGVVTKQADHEEQAQRDTNP